MSAASLNFPQRGLSPALAIDPKRIQEVEMTLS
jgi:hypothetical protein